MDEYRESDIRSRAQAQLILFHGIASPTAQEVALFILYGEDAPFLSDKKLARAATINISGGNQMKDLQAILLGLRGTKQLLSLLCTEATTVEDHDGNNLQEALFLIEEKLESSIGDLETVINHK